LTAIVGKTNKKKPFEWTAECDRAFKEAKALLAADVLLCYPDPNLSYHIYTDSSDLQLGSVIMQQDAPVAFFSRKLTDVQTRYSTIEKELLSVYETLREYRPILLGAEIHVHTDHKNLTFANLNSHRVLFWRLLIEEFALPFHYISGESNTYADAFSRLPTVTDSTVVLPEEQEPDAFVLLANCFVHLTDDDPEFGADLFGYDVINFPVLQPPTAGLPISYDTLQERQQQEQRIMDYLNDANRYEL
jgi:hypothetical protein